MQNRVQNFLAVDSNHNPTINNSTQIGQPKTDMLHTGKQSVHLTDRDRRENSTLNNRFVTGRHVLEVWRHGTNKKHLASFVTESHHVFVFSSDKMSIRGKQSEAFANQRKKRVVVLSLLHEKDGKCFLFHIRHVESNAPSTETVLDILRRKRSTERDQFFQLRLIRSRKQCLGIIDGHTVTAADNPRSVEILLNELGILRKTQKLSP